MSKKHGTISKSFNKRRLRKPKKHVKCKEVSSDDDKSHENEQNDKNDMRKETPQLLPGKKTVKQSKQELEE